MNARRRVGRTQPGHRTWRLEGRAISPKLTADSNREENRFDAATRFADRDQMKVNKVREIIEMMGNPLEGFYGWRALCARQRVIHVHPTQRLLENRGILGFCGSRLNPAREMNGAGDGEAKTAE